MRMAMNCGKKDTTLKHCEYFNKGGNYDIYLQITDSSFCVEILKQSIFVNEVIAGIKHHPRDIYCTELTQFFDSSKFPFYSCFRHVSFE